MQYIKNIWKLESFKYFPQKHYYIFGDDIIIFGDIFSCKTEIKVASETATGGVL